MFNGYLFQAEAGADRDAVGSLMWGEVSGVSGEGGEGNEPYFSLVSFPLPLYWANGGGGGIAGRFQRACMLPALTYFLHQRW